MMKMGDLMLKCFPSLFCGISKHFPGCNPTLFLASHLAAFQSDLQIPYSFMFMTCLGFLCAACEGTFGNPTPHLLWSACCV